jgi:hypothetical protein
MSEDLEGVWGELSEDEDEKTSETSPTQTKEEEARDALVIEALAGVSLTEGVTHRLAPPADLQSKTEEAWAEIEDDLRINAKEVSAQICGMHTKFRLSWTVMFHPEMGGLGVILSGAFVHWRKVPTQVLLDAYVLALQLYKTALKTHAKGQSQIVKSAAHITAVTTTSLPLAAKAPQTIAPAGNPEEAPHGLTSEDMATILAEVQRISPPRVSSLPQVGDGLPSFEAREILGDVGDVDDILAELG